MIQYPPYSRCDQIAKTEAVETESVQEIGEALLSIGLPIFDWVQNSLADLVLIFIQNILYLDFSLDQSYKNTKVYVKIKMMINTNT